MTRDLAVGSSEDHVDPFCGARFVPRPVFGDYLEHSATAALSRLRQRGWRIDLVRQRLVAAIPGANRVTLQTARGRRFTVDCTVLCVGAGRPADTYSLAGSPGFVPDPYPLSHELVGIDAQDEVGVIGSGLTAVDVVLALVVRRYQGRIRLLSRSGELPMVRQRPVPYTLRHFTPERFRAAAARKETVSLDRVIETIRTELAEAGADLGSVASEIAAFGQRDPVRLLRRHLAEVDSPTLALRILQRAVPAAGPDVWPLLPERDKAELLRSHYRAVMSLCCPMPPSSAAMLLELVDSGQLELVSGIRGVKAAAGAAERHPRGGVYVDRATSQLIVRGTADQRLYAPRLCALGDVASGSLFFTFGLPSLVDRAYDIVGAFLDDRWEAMSSRRGAALQIF